MPGNRPCPAGCTCEKHSRSKAQIRELGKSRGPCQPGCTCRRHDSVARSAAAKARWSRNAERRAQSLVGKRVAAQQREERAADFLGWIARVRGDLEPSEFITEPTSGLEEHRAMAKHLGVSIVSPTTLKRYGLDELEWLQLLAAQGWRCPICLRRVKKYNTDHEHVVGWKHMPPEERKRYVRGILCVYDNYKVVPSQMSAAEAARMAAYIYDYEARRDS